MDFNRFFSTALGQDSAPFRYQCGFAETASLPATMRVPTGLGKTATVVLGWLWRRFDAPEEIRRRTPRRLVYCLPMRTLVNQTADAAKAWVDRLELTDKVGVHVLMGGESAEDWDLAPDRPAILVGTQDMLLSRALNRGYAMSRYRWPMPFGLLHSDCVWVFDEVQLMDVGVATSAQLEAFRRELGTAMPAQSVWMSATLDERWLETVDFPKSALGWRLELDEQDFAHDYVQKLWTAPKPLSAAPDAPMGEPAACAQAIAAAHRAGTKTLAVFNTVRRATDVYKELRKVSGGCEPVLLHSRFRQEDRDGHLDALLKRDDVIAVATQVVEAGVDVSATTLLTEVAPWASLVQRFGRCNRRGEDTDARVLWFDPGEIEDGDNSALPYEAADLREARRLLLECKDVSLEALEQVRAEMRLEPEHVIRRRDLIDLFDTTPDLAGNDIDVSRFIRSGEEHDVKVFWRAFDEKPDKDAASGRAPRREELCSVPVHALQQFKKKNRGEVWRWDGLEESWRPVEEREIYAGQTYLMRAVAGGYDSEVGWNPKSGAVEPLELDADPPEGHSSDFEDGPWLSIARHTDDVCSELDEILDELTLEPALREALREAARWHDWGKAHDQFQGAVDREVGSAEWRNSREIAKAPKWGRYERRGFRHELASALGMLALGKPDLSVYLVAAHHGKVRLSIRSLPKEKRPPEPGRLFARGIWDGDPLPGVDLGGEERAPEVPELSLECMQLGRSADGVPSWAERMLRLRDELGPFRLAYLEALLRAADQRASAAEAKEGARNG